MNVQATCFLALLFYRSLDGLLSKYYPKTGWRAYKYCCCVCLDRFRTKELRDIHQQKYCTGRKGAGQVEEWPDEKYRYKFSSLNKQYLTPLIG